MGRLTEALHMLNCSSREWSEWETTHNNKEELKRIRKKYRKGLSQNKWMGYISGNLNNNND